MLTPLANVSKNLTAYAVEQLHELVIDSLNFEAYEINATGIHDLRERFIHMYDDLDDIYSITPTFDNVPGSESPEDGTGALPLHCLTTLDGNSSQDPRIMTVGVRRLANGQKVLVCDCNCDGRGLPCVHKMKYILARQVNH